MNVDVHHVILKNEGSVCLFFCVPELSQEREGAFKTHSLFLCHQMKGKEVVALQWRWKRKERQWGSSDIKSRNETGFLTRLSNCLSIDSWGTTSDPEDAQMHSGGRGLFLPPALSLCSQGHLFVFQVNITPFCHASLTCFLPPLLCLPSPSPEFTQQD